jgi:hypothetical protein
LEVKVWVRKVVLVLVDDRHVDGDVGIGKSVEVVLVRDGRVRDDVKMVRDVAVEVARTAEMARSVDASSVDGIEGVVVKTMDVVVVTMDIVLEVRGFDETTRTVEVFDSDEMTGVVEETTAAAGETARTVEVSGVDEMFRDALEVANIEVDEDLEMDAKEDVGDTTWKVDEYENGGVVGEEVGDGDKEGDGGDDGKGDKDITDRNDKDITGMAVVTSIEALVVALVMVPVPDVALSEEDTTEEDTTEEDTTEEDTTEEDTTEEDTTEEDTTEDEEVAALLDGSITTQFLCAVIRSLMIVTGPFNANSPPSTVTPAFNEIDISARILSAKIVEAPSVAEDPTCQKTLHACAPLMRMTTVAVAVVSLDPIWKMKTAFGLFWPSRTMVPVITTDDAAV